MKPSTSSALHHIPGRDGLPFIGETVAFVRNPYTWSKGMHDAFGPVVRTNVFFEASLSIADADFAERFLVDKEKLFSSELGWWSVLGKFFQRGLMLRDFEVHRLHRRIMQVAFKKEALSGYVAIMTPIIEAAVEQAHTLAFPWVKQMTLDSAAAIFLGFSGKDDTRRVNRLFTDIMVAATTPVRVPLAGFAYGRGLKARDELHAWLRGLIPQRRANPGTDMMSLLCSATDEDGERFSDEDIVYHLIFLLMAAHDTTTSALTNLLMELGQRMDWQNRLREQSLAIGAINEDNLNDLALIYDCFREVLRLYPPVRTIPRRTLRDTEIMGHQVPKNTQIWLHVERIQRDPALWSQPEAFDPERFSPSRAEHKRHKFAFLPFGGGAHTCLGLQFSELQTKILMHALLTRYEWTASPSEMGYLPFIKPKNDLPLKLTRP